MPLQLETLNWIATNLRVPRGRSYDPFAHAEALNIQVLHRPITKSNELWLPDYNTIVLKSGMRAGAQRCALAHGIGHADLGHYRDDAKSEHQADRYASLYLIDPAEFEDAVRWEYDTARIAAELG